MPPRGARRAAQRRDADQDHGVGRGRSPYDPVWNLQYSEEEDDHRGLKPQSQRKKPRGKTMPAHIAAAAQKCRLGLVVRNIGLVRARVKIGLANFAYNFTRLAGLAPRSNCARLTPTRAVKPAQRYPISPVNRRPALRSPNIAQIGLLEVSEYANRGHRLAER